MGTRYWIIMIITVVIGLSLRLFFFSSNSPLEEKLRHMYLLSNRGSHYWHYYFKQPGLSSNGLFPPSTSQQENEVVAYHGEQDEQEIGKGEKVKEAVEKSFEKAKSMVEESAKWAAKVAGDTVRKTAELVKETLTQPSRLNVPPQDEL